MGENRNVSQRWESRDPKRSWNRVWIMWPWCSCHPSMFPIKALVFLPVRQQNCCSNTFISRCSERHGQELREGHILILKCKCLHPVHIKSFLCKQKWLPSFCLLSNKGCCGPSQFFHIFKYIHTVCGEFASQLESHDSYQNARWRVDFLLKRNYPQIPSHTLCFSQTLHPSSGRAATCVDVLHSCTVKHQNWKRW